MLPVMAEYIAIKSGFCGGKPHLLGHRIKVQHVAVWHEKMGLAPEEIVASHEGLSLSAVYAALAYYHAHRAEIDADIAAALISNHFAMLTSPTWQMLRSESAHAIRGSGQTLQWLATDTADGAGAWFVERRPDGAAWRPATRQADVTVTGPARSLLLTLTRRLPLTDRETTNISVAGDTDLASSNPARVSPQHFAK